MEKDKSLVSERDIAALAVATSSRLLFTGVGVPVGAATVVGAAPVIASALIGAGAYYLGKLFLSDEDESAEERLVEEINRTTLDVKVGDKQGTTICYIENLNINITNEVVKQMNINPKEGINQLQTQLKESIQTIKIPNAENVFINPQKVDFKANEDDKK